MIKQILFILTLVTVVAINLGGAKDKPITSTQNAMPGVFTDSAIGMDFVLVKGGCFQMGDTFGDGRDWEKPVHDVCVADYYISKYEVTQRQWLALMEANHSLFRKCGIDCPVTKVSWNDAKEYIDRLNKKTGKKYRLPTEAEWEYAARSGGKKDKWAGTSNETDLGDYAWYMRNSRGKPSILGFKIGLKKPNGLGLYDMTGSVWEWCQDWFSKTYYSESPKNNPTGPSNGDFRVLRGGSYLSDTGSIRISYRLRNEPSLRSAEFGFRLVFLPNSK